MEVDTKLMAAVLNVLKDGDSTAKLNVADLERIAAAVNFITYAAGGRFHYKGWQYNRLAAAFKQLAATMPPEPTEPSPD